MVIMPLKYVTVDKEMTRWCKVPSLRENVRNNIIILLADDVLRLCLNLVFFV